MNFFQKIIDHHYCVLIDCSRLINEYCFYPIELQYFMYDKERRQTKDETGMKAVERNQHNVCIKKRLKKGKKKISKKEGKKAKAFEIRIFYE